MMKKIFIILMSIFTVTGCGGEKQNKMETQPSVIFEKEKEVQMKIKSPAFNDGGFIPANYTADGEDISPPLEIEGVPEGAATLVLIVDDPDAPGGNWDHWILWNIPATTAGIEAGTHPPCIKGRNDFGTLDYGGPAPPSGTHRYFFKLYALDKKLELKEGTGKAALLKAMDGHTLGTAVLIGKYSRH